GVRPGQPPGAGSGAHPVARAAVRRRVPAGGRAGGRDGGPVLSRGRAPDPDARAAVRSPRPGRRHGGRRRGRLRPDPPGGVAGPLGRVRTVRLVLEYDGTGYCGWQRQRGSAAGGAPSVQATLEAALRRATGVATPAVGAGRTDAGVHALGQVVHFTTHSRIPAVRWPAALNARLPPDICVLGAEEMPDGFHARFDAVSRTYRYEILNRPAPSALLRHRAYHVPDPLDMDAMQRSLTPFLGRHDFAAYRGAGTQTRTTLCTITRAECRRTGARVRVTVTADWFLRHMVRILVGTLVRVGTGRLPAEAPAAFLSDPDNRRTGPNLPAHGLYLVRVDYAP